MKQANICNNILKRCAQELKKCFIFFYFSCTCMPFVKYIKIKGTFLLSFLLGRKGSEGSAGADGPQGSEGSAGRDGSDGAAGRTGDTGSAGNQGQ